MNSLVVIFVGGGSDDLSHSELYLRVCPPEVVFLSLLHEDDLFHEGKGLLHRLAVQDLVEHFGVLQEVIRANIHVLKHLFYVRQHGLYTSIDPIVFCYRYYLIVDISTFYYRVRHLHRYLR